MSIFYKWNNCKRRRSRNHQVSLVKDVHTVFTHPKITSPWRGRRNSVVLERKMFTHDGRRQPIAIGHLSDSLPYSCVLWLASIYQHQENIYGTNLGNSPKLQAIVLSKSTSLWTIRLSTIWNFRCWITRF